MAKDKNKTITINDIEYNLDDFSQEQSAMLNHINDVDRKLANARFNVDQLALNREAFVKALAESLEDITLQNDSDGNGDYIAKWEHPTLAQPTQEQLNAVGGE